MKNTIDKKVDNTNAAVIELWRNNKRGKNLLSPLIYGKLTENCLLFIGFNPSYSTKNHETIKAAEPTLSKVDFARAHLFANIKTQKSRMIQIQKAAKEHINYFARMREISADTSIAWEHVDLFFERNVSQKRIVKDYTLKRGLSEFGRKQLELALNLIEAIRPRIIVVANAMARRTLETVWHDTLREDKKLGTPQLLLGGRKVPIFFCSMLSGRAALDTGSFKRLKWHIANVARKH